MPDDATDEFDYSTKHYIQCFAARSAIRREPFYEPYYSRRWAIRTLDRAG